MISIQHIIKQYANHRALDDVSIEIPQGKIFGLLGPNGAGKTSLIRIINQITAPDSGIILFNGEPLQAGHISKIGYLPEERGLYKKMEIGEQMLYLAQLKGLSKQEAIHRIKYWFEKLEIESWWNKKVEDLSKGMQQKVQFVATVLHKPDLIILDEPFSGFDPVNANIIKDEILALNREGATIIFSTHRMESVEELCDHIALINQSKKILDGSVKSIKNQFKTQTYQINYQAIPGISDTLHHATLFEVQSHHQDEEESQIVIKLADNIQLNDILPFFISKVHIHQIVEIIPTFHDIFVSQVTQHSNQNLTQPNNDLIPHA